MLLEWGLNLLNQALTQARVIGEGRRQQDGLGPGRQLGRGMETGVGGQKGGT